MIIPRVSLAQRPILQQKTESSNTMLPDWVKRLISTAFIVKFGALGADLGLFYWIYRAARGSESMSKIVEL